MNLSADFIETISAAVAVLREKKPLIHCISNYVTAGDTANILLAAGASPVMADCPEEVSEITSAADALLINLGTLSKSRLTAMLIAGKTANRKNIPVILDPVGAGASAFRREAIERLFSEVKISAVRGNLSEISVIGGFSAGEQGVDTGKSSVTAEEAAITAAKKRSCICAATGKYDIVSDGSRTIRLENGTEMLSKITGAGCMTSALCAAYSAISDPFSGTILAVAVMGICGELSSEKCGGAGSFRTGIFDEISKLTAKTAAERIKIYEA